MSVQRSSIFLVLFAAMIGLGYLRYEPKLQETHSWKEELLLADISEKIIDPDTFDYEPLKDEESEEDADTVMIDFLTKLIASKDVSDLAYVDLIAKGFGTERARREMLWVPGRTYEVKGQREQYNHVEVPTVKQGGVEVYSNFPSDKTLAPFEEGDYSTTESSFYVSRKAVTNREYRDFLKATGRPAPIHWNDTSLRSSAKDIPVVNITWEEAKAYADWAGRRLPQFSEMERASRQSSSLRLGAPMREWTSTPADPIQGKAAYQRFNGTPLGEEESDFYTGFRLVADEE